MRELKPIEPEFVCGGRTGEYRTAVFNQVSLWDEPPQALIPEFEPAAEKAYRPETGPIPLHWLPPGDDRRRVY